MSENFKNLSENEEPEESSSDLATLVKKMQQHLIYLEKKIDTLIQLQQQAAEKPAFAPRPRPSFGGRPRFGGGGGGGRRDFRSGGRERDRGERGGDRGDRGGFRGGRDRDDRGGDRGDRGGDREGGGFRSGGERPFQKREGSGGGGFGGKKRFSRPKRDRY